MNFEIISELKGFSIDNRELFPYELMNPQEGTGFLIVLYEGPANVIKVRTSWDDGYKSGNTYEQVLTL